MTETRSPGLRARRSQNTVPGNAHYYWFWGSPSISSASSGWMDVASSSLSVLKSRRMSMNTTCSRTPTNPISSSTSYSSCQIYPYAYMSSPSRVHVRTWTCCWSSHAYSHAAILSMNDPPIAVSIIRATKKLRLHLYQGGNNDELKTSLDPLHLVETCYLWSHNTALLAPWVMKFGSVWNTLVGPPQPQVLQRLEWTAYMDVRKLLSCWGKPASTPGPPVSEYCYYTTYRPSSPAPLGNLCWLRTCDSNQ